MKLGWGEDGLEVKRAWTEAKNQEGTNPCRESSSSKCNQIGRPLPRVSLVF